jgi:hypothetical protein
MNSRSMAMATGCGVELHAVRGAEQLADLADEGRPITSTHPALCCTIR